MKFPITATIFILFCGQFLFAQQENFEDLSFYSDVMVNASEDSHRERASIEFIQLFEKTIKSENAFEFPYEEIPFIKTLTAQDTSFKIISFSYSNESGKSLDNGYVILKDNSVFELEPETDLQDIEYETLDHTRWIASLYYHMVPFQKDSMTYYVLFGFSQPNSFEKRKVLEVFSIQDNKPVFGGDFFIEKQDGARDIARQRELYYYSADVAMSIRDDKDFNALVIDHLMEVKSRIPGQSGNTFVPDGTYTAYFLKDGYWEYKDKLFEQKDVNKLEEKESKEVKKDIFGNSKN